MKTHVSPLALALTLLTLLALWGLSLGLSYVGLTGGAALGVALGIAAVKALLVVLVFMEIAFERPSIVLALTAAVLLGVTLFVLMDADVLTREPPPLLPPR